MQLTSWVEVLEKKLISTGMDTPFNVVIDKEKRPSQQHLKMFDRQGIEEINILHL